MSTLHEIGDTIEQPIPRALVRAVWEEDGTWSEQNIPSSEVIWGSPRFSVNDSPPDTLSALTVRYADWQSVSVGYEIPADRIIPHPHIAFLTPTKPYAATIEADLIARMGSSWGETYIDPYMGSRARFFPATNIRSGIALWGRGIFVPRVNERPIGDVHLARRNKDGSWGAFEPITIGQTSEPVGLYRGQSAVVFSGDPTVTLGSVERLYENDGSPLYYVAPSIGLGAADSALKLEIQRPPSQPNCTILSTRTAQPIEGYDAGFEIRLGTGELFQLGIRLDNRKSRLIRNKIHRGFRIHGLLAPRKRPYRWWINLADDRMLVSSAMMTTTNTIMVQNGGLSLFDWRDLKWRSNKRFARLDRVTVDGESRQAVLFSAPVGYLSYGSNWSETSFAWEQMLTETPSLDWLDFAGALQLDVWGTRKGLAEAEHETGAFIGATGSTLRKVAPLATPGAHDFAEDYDPEYALGPLLLSAI